MHRYQVYISGYLYLGLLAFANNRLRFAIFVHILVVVVGTFIRYRYIYMVEVYCGCGMGLYPAIFARFFSSGAPISKGAYRRSPPPLFRITIFICKRLSNRISRETNLCAGIINTV